MKNQIELFAILEERISRHYSPQVGVKLTTDLWGGGFMSIYPTDYPTNTLYLNDLDNLAIALLSQIQKQSFKKFKKQSLPTTQS